MTHPLTPREKVAAVVLDAAAAYLIQQYGASHGLDHEIDRARIMSAIPNDAILTALASGSGDHAELARLADDLRKFEHHSVGSLKISMDEVRRIIAVCDAHAALLTENAALRDANDVLEVERIGLRSAIFGSNDYDPALRHGNFIEMARTTEDARKGALNRATEAERKLAEAVGLLRDLASWFDGSAYNGAWVIRSGDLGVDDAICAARTFLGKEAERG